MVVFARRHRGHDGPTARLRPSRSSPRSSCVLVVSRGRSSSSSPTWARRSVLSCIAFGILFMSGVPLAPLTKVLARSSVPSPSCSPSATPTGETGSCRSSTPAPTSPGSGYQVWQSLIGLGSGHLFGLGLGGGREKWGLLPNAHTDFIFSVVGEELGLVGASAILGSVLRSRPGYGLRAAARAPDRFGCLWRSASPRGSPARRSSTSARSSGCCR